jgi:hypothetical protein
MIKTYCRYAFSFSSIGEGKSCEVDGLPAWCFYYNKSRSRTYTVKGNYHLDAYTVQTA